MTHAREQYTRDLLCATVCDLLLAVVLRIDPAPHAAYQDRRQDVKVFAGALYAKLNGGEPRVSAALVRETAKDLSAILDALAVKQEPWLPGYAVRILDGNLPYTALTPWTAAAGQRLCAQAIAVEGHPYRRVRVELTTPTRDGDAPIDLITDLLESVDAATVAALYRRRWTLETAFQHLEQHVASELNTLAYPRAALFGFCLALVAYNVFSVSGRRCAAD